MVVAWAQNPAEPRREDVAGPVKGLEKYRGLLDQLPGNFCFPETSRKALRMLIRLHATGFASFACEKLLPSVMRERNRDRQHLPDPK
jgi:hypothetical protein